MIPSAPKHLLISTPGQGKEVSVVEPLANDWAILKRASQQGFYYPMLAVKHLKALSTGLSGKHNVFIPNINDFKTNSFQKVVVFVPGIMATVERRANDSLKVTKLELSEEYKTIERGSEMKPGVYTVIKNKQGVQVSYKNNGRITPKDERKVVVANTEYSSPIEAAKETAKKLKAMFGGNAALKSDFDLFYSPVGSRLGNMRNYNPNILTKGYAFAGLLADSIEQSKKQKGVEWASELGGSVVLTQALQALANKGVSFADQKHIVNMYEPTTDPAPALAAAIQLGMIADKNIATGSHNFWASIGGMGINAARARNKNDHYTWGDYAKSLSGGGSAAVGAAGALTVGAGLVVSSPLLSPLLGTVGTVTGAVGAIQFAYSTIKKRMKKG